MFKLFLLGFQARGDDGVPAGHELVVVPGIIRATLAFAQSVEVVSELTDVFGLLRHLCEQFASCLFALPFQIKSCRMRSCLQN